MIQILVALTSLTGYHYDLRLRSRGSYILVGIWCLMAVVLANAYGGVLFSFLSVAKLEQPINTLEELANSNEVQLTVSLGTETARNFMVSRSLMFLLLISVSDR